MNSRIILAMNSKYLNEIFQYNPTKNFIEDFKNNIFITYSKFNKLSVLVEKIFKANGIKEGHTIVVSCSNSWMFVVFFFVSIRMKISILPLTKDLTKVKILQLKKLINLEFLVSDYDFTFSSKESKSFFFLYKLNKQDKSILFLNKFSFEYIFETSENLSEKKITNIDFNKDFLIVNTSGTTGESKLIFHSLKNIVGAAQSFINFHNLESNLRLLQVFSMTYMAGILNSIFISFLSRGTLVLYDEFNALSPLYFWKNVIDSKSNTIWLAPTMLKAILKLDRNQEINDYKHKIKLFVATSYLDNKVALSFLKKYFIKPVQTYGLSELLFVSSNTLNNIKNSAGLPIDGVKIRISEENEILVKSNFTMKAQIDKRNKKKPNNTWFSTGDIGFLDEKGHLAITGRKKDIIIKGGLNIPVKEIENLVKGTRIITEAVVVGITDKFYGEKVCLFYTTKDKKKVSVDRINNLLLKKLPQKFKPDIHVHIEKFSYTLSGKIKKSELTKKYL